MTAPVVGRAAVSGRGTRHRGRVLGRQLQPAAGRPQLHSPPVGFPHSTANAVFALIGANNCIHSDLHVWSDTEFEQWRLNHGWDV